MVIAFRRLPRLLENVNLGSFFGGNLNQKRRGVKMGIRKYSKTFKNIQKRANFRVETFKNIQKYSKTFKNIQIFWATLGK